LFQGLEPFQTLENIERSLPLSTDGLDSGVQSGDLIFGSAGHFNIEQNVLHKTAPIARAPENERAVTDGKYIALFAAEVTAS
jgi:hypothetical protein